MVQLNPNFYSSISNIASKFSNLRFCSHAQQAPNKTISNINVVAQMKANHKLAQIHQPDLNIVIDEIKDGNSELHPFTFHQGNLNKQPTFSSNVHKLNLKLSERNHDVVSENKAELSTINVDSHGLAKKFIEISISGYKLVCLNCCGLSFIGIFSESTFSKLCKLILLHIFTTFSNSSFSDSFRAGFIKMTKEDIIRAKVFEVVWMKLIVSTFSSNIAKLINSSNYKPYNTYEFSNYYLISIAKKPPSAELKTFIFDRNNYLMLVNLRKFSRKAYTDYLKSDLIYKEIAYQGELLRKSFLKENGNGTEQFVEIANEVSHELCYSLDFY